ncbi:hypothetical protein GGU11DRAFT_223629 [Lentinula aff. detonsa]|nr:hypothetical protein GGU11DRAFT_223629 [Lentinula aff. detonsa]
MAPKIPGAVHDILGVGLRFTYRDLSTDPFPKHSPIQFLDKHLDENYVLKRVISLPGTELLTELLDFANELLESVEEFPRTHFPAITIHSRSASIEDLNADTVAKYYQESISEGCCWLASHLFLHSKATRWCNDLSWKQVDGLEPRSLPLHKARMERRLAEEHFVSRKWSLVLDRNSPSNVWKDSLTSDEQKTWRYLSDCSQRTQLAVWEIFSCTVASDHLFESIRKYAGKSTEERPEFPWKRPGTKEFRIQHPPYKPYSDATQTPWTLPDESLSLGASQRSRASNCDEGTSGPKSSTQPTVIRPLDSLNRGNIEIEDISVWVEDYLQRAWARAVDLDATFIILHRGTTEIICIRHRESQTLFVSEIIDTSVNYYGKLQTAIYAAIVKDQAQRQEMWEKRHLPKAEMTEKKRSFNHVEPDNSYMRKRRRSSSLSLKTEKDAPSTNLTLKERCRKLDLAIVVLNYSLHRSSIPSIFIRRKFNGRDLLAPLSVQSSYPLESCLRIDVRSRIGGGASGHAHRAMMYIGSDNEHFQDVVVKVGRDDYSRQSMRHELQIYEYLARAKVESVPHCYGLFEDIESKHSPYILVTSYAGKSLADLQRKEYIANNGTVTVPKIQHPAFLRGLAEIHAAGIHHRDLRPPNIVIDKNGKVSIIDFDIARLYVTGRQRKHERKRMLKLLSGQEVDYDRTSFRGGHYCDDCSPGTHHAASQWDSEEELVRARSEPP